MESFFEKNQIFFTEKYWKRRKLNVFADNYGRMIEIEVEISIKKGQPSLIDLYLYAEKEGFEPPVPCGTTVFKTAAFDHSAISPLQK